MPQLTLNEDIILEGGQILSKPTIQYHTYGQLNENKSNVIWVCHALTANSDVFEWWPGLFGENDFFNPNEHFIVCANFLGSHYGTTGPLSVNPKTQQPYYHDFPLITVRDVVKMHIHLADHLSIQQIHLLIGGSVGGHQALEWSIEQPNRIDNLCLLATSAAISPWAAAFNESQRMCIEQDPTWNKSTDDAGINGMAIARSIALLSYRNQRTYNQTQSQDLDVDIYQTKAASYQKYQGLKLTKRFNAFSYWHISKTMDSHNIARQRGPVSKVLKSIKAKTLILSLEDDILFPKKDQAELHKYIPNSTHVVLPSLYGHDGFLLEVKQIKNQLESFLFVGIEV